MTEEEINKKAYDLISLVESIEIVRNNERSELVGSAKERGFVDWSNKVVGDGIERSLNPSDEPSSIFLTTSSHRIGFNEKHFPVFIELVRNIHKLQKLYKTASLEFIEKKTFEWIIKIYQSNISECDLTNYLTREIENCVADYQYYFPVINLEIDSPFKIGNVEFMYFTKEYFEILYQKLNKLPTPISEKDFEAIFIKDYQGQVLAKISVKAEAELAEAIAKNECSLAVDVLKIYGLTTVIPEKKTMFDLNFRLNYQVKSNFLSQEISTNDNLLVNLKFNNPTFNITSQQIEFAKQNGFETFSHFITLNNQDELYRLIIQGIGLLGASLSNWDLHLRVINLITLLESLLLKDEEDNDMERKVKARLSKIISDNHKEKEELKELFTKIYKIRHKMVHKAIKLPINTTELMNAQITIINLLLKLMRYNVIDKHNCKASVIEVLNKINS